MNSLKTLAVLGNIFLAYAFQNNVCKSFADYYTNIDQNKNCYYNPDGQLSTPQIIERHGYPVESHKVTTDDGYILTIFRIPYSKIDSTESMIRKPIFLQHGISVNSAFFINGGNDSLGFYLSDAGYDVWLGNFRGSKYSLKHKTLSNLSDQFWDFSFHEHGLYDLSAQIVLIKKVTNQKVIHIGHSMGTTAAFVYGSLQPKLSSENIKYSIALAPVVFMQDIWFQPFVEPVYQLLKHYKKLTAVEGVIQKLCYSYPFQIEFCGIIGMFLEGFNYEQIIPETYPIVFQRDSVSSKVAVHYYQLIKSRNFQQFDYGPNKNYIKYGSTHPPEYNLSNINFPVQLIVAPNDQIATVKNAEKLYQALPKGATRNTTIYTIKNEKSNHSSFITGKDAKSLTFDIILQFLSQIM